jgi:tetratricopeptide (TPR) repeat protein
MPAPKPDKSLLTATEKERLTNEGLDPAIRKRNDMIVRNKILAWLNSADEVLSALNQISLKKLKKDIDDSRIYELLKIVRELLDIKDFCKLYDTGKNVVAVKSILVHHNRNNFIGPHPHAANDKDFERIFYIETALEDIIDLLPNPNNLPAYEEFKNKRLDKWSNSIASMVTNFDKKGANTLNFSSIPESNFWNNKGSFFLFYSPPGRESKSKIEMSIEYFDKATKADPGNYDAWLNKGFALGFLNKYEESLICFDKVLKIEPLNRDALELKVSALESLGRTSEAQKIEAEISHETYPEPNLREESQSKCSDKATEIDSSNVNALFHKASELGNQGKYEEALKCVEKILAIDPSDSEIWRMKAIFNQSIENYEDSLEDIDKAIGINPSNTPAIIMKINILKKLNKEIEAEDLILDLFSHHFKNENQQLLRKFFGW